KIVRLKSIILCVPILLQSCYAAKFSLSLDPPVPLYPTASCGLLSPEEGPMDKKLFLLDGMALLYRAHFAFIARPIRTSYGLNTSALYGFTNTLLEIAASHEPTHLAVALDTAAPTQRHRDFPGYKAQRQEMPEDLSSALPHLPRWAAALRVPVL